MLVAKLHQHLLQRTLFENYVNYAGSKTITYGMHACVKFENYVNYAGSKTEELPSHKHDGLRTM